MKGEPHHLVSVWNPAYASDAMEAHLRVLLKFADAPKSAGTHDDTYVWWGKVRSSNRQQPQANQDDIRKVGEEIDDHETHLYLTDYRSLYVGDLDEIVEGVLPAGEEDHVPAYYTENHLNCDFWFRVVDIRRLVTDDLLGVIEDLKQLRNVHYNDRPVSLYGGMVDLPLVVTRPDRKEFFVESDRDDITEGRLWAKWDAERGAGLGSIERELRENLFGSSAWSALEPTVRTCIATGEQIFRSHRNDPGFDFGPVIVSFAKAMEVQCNALLRRLLKNAPPKARLAKLQDSTRDILEWKPLSLGELGHVMGGEWDLNGYLSSVIAGTDKWFTRSLPAILDDFASVRNPGTHSTSVDRETATRWRDRLMGVGCEGDFVKLARVRAA